MKVSPDAAVTAEDTAGPAELRSAAPAGPGSRALRDVLGRYATGVAVITCVGPRGAPIGVTVNSFTSVSLDPPLVLWCLAMSSRSRPAFTDAEYFAVNVLAADQRELASRFAGPGRRFQGLATEPGPHGEPLITGAAATLCCRRARLLPAGDHMVVLGAVQHHARTARRILLFADGAYHEGPRRGSESDG